MKTRNASLQLALLLLALLIAGWGLPQGAFAYPTIPAVEVWEQPDMPKGTAVLGRDTGSAIPYAGRYIYTYGDTALSQANSEGKTWINNSMYHTADSNGDDGIAGGYNFKTSGQPALQWIPNTQAEIDYNNTHTEDKVVWPASSFKDPNTNKVYQWFGLVLVNGPNFSGIGEGFSEITSLTLKTTRIQHRPGQTEPYLMFLASEGNFGSVSVVSGGYLYVYAVNSNPEFGNLYVARVSLTDGADAGTTLDYFERANYRFWNGSSWVADVNAKAAISGGVMPGSIAWNTHLNCWVHTYMEWVGDHMCMKVADNLWGPWSAAKVLYTGQHSSDGGTPYSGRAYPMIEKESGRCQYTSYCTPMGPDGIQRVPMVRTRFYTPVASPATGVWYKVIARHSGKSMDVSYGSTADGADVWQWSTTGDYAQQWMLESVGTGIYRIKVRHSSKYLDADANQSGNSQSLQQWSYVGGLNQQWELVSKGGGYFAIKSRQNGGRIATVAYLVETQGMYMHLNDDLNNPAQQFAFAIP